jgi:hypothetical protein
VFLVDRGGGGGPPPATLPEGDIHIGNSFSALTVSWGKNFRADVSAAELFPEWLTSAVNGE